MRRRRFLFLAGVACGGVALGAGVARRFQTKPTITNPGSPLPGQTPSPTRVTSPNPAPPGMYAPPRGDLRIAVISDLNSQYGSTTYEPEVLKAVELIPYWEPDLVLCSGDMVAGQYPSLTEPEIKAMWDAFDANVAAPLRKAKLPYGFTLGNHDASSARSLSGGFLFQKERDLAAAYWRDPSHPTGLNFIDRGDFPFYYSFMVKEGFFLTWDASGNIVPQEQIEWAERSLASEIAQKAKVRIVVGHLPLYAITYGREFPGEYLDRAEELRALMEKYRVHTYISGHDHAYYPAHKGKLELLNMGILGSGVRQLLNGNTPLFKAMTIIDVKTDSETVTYTTYNMNTLRVVELQELPRLIATPTGQIYRLDIQESDLTPEERAMKFI
ncbi:MAG: metallophosphoesterase family protein, partial [Pseudanabaenaceae cyanobacterium]